VSAHRIKTYSAESGYVYQYSFQSSQRAMRGGFITKWFSPGTEFLFEVSRDRKTAYPLTVFVRDDATRAWQRRHGRGLEPAETYAAAKMGMLRAFDALDDPERELSEVVVDAETIDALLMPLDIA
jgi:hypothetical protein